jgi:hypothetical protein
MADRARLTKIEPRVPPIRILKYQGTSEKLLLAQRSAIVSIVTKFGAVLPPGTGPE